MTPQYSIEIGQRNQRAILNAMPGTTRQIAEKTGIKPGTVESIIKRLRQAGQLEIVGKVAAVRGGYASAIYSDTSEGPPAIVPVTQYRTRWIGGSYPQAAA